MIYLGGMCEKFCPLFYAFYMKQNRLIDCLVVCCFRLLTNKNMAKQSPATHVSMLELFYASSESMLGGIHLIMLVRDPCTLSPLQSHLATCVCIVRVALAEGIVMYHVLILSSKKVVIAEVFKYLLNL